MSEQENLEIAQRGYKAFTEGDIPTLRNLLINCPLCGADDHVPWARENGYAAVKCKQCGLVYVNPRPSLSTISEAAKTGVHKTDAGNLPVVFRRSPRKFSAVGPSYGECSSQKSWRASR